jgi:hypothetical protein
MMEKRAAIRMACGNSMEDLGAVIICCCISRLAQMDGVDLFLAYCLVEAAYLEGKVLESRAKTRKLLLYVKLAAIRGVNQPVHGNPRQFRDAACSQGDADFVKTRIVLVGQTEADHFTFRWHRRPGMLVPVLNKLPPLLSHSGNPVFPVNQE